MPATTSILQPSSTPTNTSVPVTPTLEANPTPQATETLSPAAEAVVAALLDYKNSEGCRIGRDRSNGVVDVPGDDPSVLDFCSICKKCAENCPSQAIPMDDRQEVDGVQRWKIDSSKCFHYWIVIGTDCGRCMMVCPYFHATDVTHKLMPLR